MEEKSNFADDTIMYFYSTTQNEANQLTNDMLFWIGLE